LIYESKSRVRSILPDWGAIALDGAQPVALRIAALRAINAAGLEAIDEAALLRPLLNDPDRSVASEAREALLAAGDQAVVAEAVSVCAPANKQLASFDVPESSYCIYKLARFRKRLSIVGPRLLQFATSPNGGEAALAIDMIAELDYKPAEPQLIAGLSSPDWRVAYASADALGVLGLPDAIPALENTSQTYWLPEVRNQARRSFRTRPSFWADDR
jgi:HEAT repeat protein